MANDVITLNSGEVITGTITSENATQLVIEVANASRTIFTSRSVSKSEIKNNKPETAAEQQERLAYDAVKKYRLNPDQEFTAAQYDAGITACQKFLETYPASEYAAAVNPLGVQLQQEKEQVAKGLVKFGSRWMSASQKASEQDLRVSFDKVHRMQRDLAGLEKQRDQINSDIAAAKLGSSNANKEANDAKDNFRRTEALKKRSAYDGKIQQSVDLVSNLDNKIDHARISLEISTRDYQKAKVENERLFESPVDEHLSSIGNSPTKILPTPDGARTHVVKKGDTWESIALQYYGNRASWSIIYAANLSGFPKGYDLPKPMQPIYPGSLCPPSKVRQPLVIPAQVHEYAGVITGIDSTKLLMTVINGDDNEKTFTVSDDAKITKAHKTVAMFTYLKIGRKVEVAYISNGVTLVASQIKCLPVEVHSFTGIFEAFDAHTITIKNRAKNEIKTFTITSESRILNHLVTEYPYYSQQGIEGMEFPNGITKGRIVQVSYAKEEQILELVNFGGAGMVEGADGTSDGEGAEWETSCTVQYIVKGGMFSKSCLVVSMSPGTPHVFALENHPKQDSLAEGDRFHCHVRREGSVEGTDSKGQFRRLPRWVYVSD